MGLSIWEYIRERARDAVLAGVHDALDVAEQGDTNGSQHLAAEQLASRFIGLKQLLNTSVNGEQPEAEASTAADEVEAGLTEAPRSPVEPSSFDDELEKRLAAAAAGPDNAAQGDGATPEPPLVTRRRRGRPRKNEAH